ncbi:MAG: chemotaxis response regulator protein-glutamate methylesterase [Thiotrichaceae bacterium]|nr:chemotaxis response regulator protein-glutamate methylesterase [Thiotrichaceae bacterium]PCI13698.1 MAG: chemotaxis response regulator protein-glutamate methylesterase [Thiotrichales bacterium]
MRVAIVNDMMVAVEGLKRILSTATDHQLAWVAINGEEAVNKCANDLPDLILMDLIMPVMNGVEASRKIMDETPCPILIVTGSVDGNSTMVFEAMGAGALDVVKTPVLNAFGYIQGEVTILDKIKTIEKLTQPRAPRERVNVAPRASRWLAQRNQSLVILGSSTGGPPALAKVLADFPVGFTGSVIIIQHIDAHFACELVEWLDTQCKMQVKVAEEGEEIAPGIVYLAATNDHLVMSSNGRLAYTAEPREMVYRPSVDVFFESVALHWGGRLVAALLTGMGRDGALGLLALRQKGVHTIAQDEASCAVYGMPKAAAALNAAVEVLPLDGISAVLLKRYGSVIRN